MEMLGGKQDWYAYLIHKFGWEHRARIIDGECRQIGGRNGTRIGRLVFIVEVKQAKKYVIYRHSAKLIFRANGKCKVKLEPGFKKICTRKTPYPPNPYADPDY